MPPTQILPIAISRPLRFIGKTPWLLLVVWSLPLLLAGFFNLEHQSLIAYDEGLYASRARLMLDTGDWVHPWDTLHHKTPGPYWLLAISMQVLGQNELAVRLPSVLASLGCTILTYEIGKRLIGAAAALWGSLSLSATFLWLQYSRFATPDIVFTCGILLSVFCLLRAEESWSQNRAQNRAQNQSGFQFLAGFCLGFGFLVRSFLAALPMLCLVPYLVFEQRRHLSSPSLYAGFLTGLLPTLGWLYLCWQRFGGALWQELVAFPRRLGVEQSQSGDNPLFYPLNLLVNDFPWVFFAIAGLYLVFRHHRLRYTRLWLLAYPVFFFAILSAATTRMPHYALSAYPFLALFAGVAIDTLAQTQKPTPSLRLGLKLINGLLLGLGSGLIGLSLIVLTPDVLPIDRSEIAPYTPIALSLGLGWVVTSQFAHTRSRWLVGLLLSNGLALLATGATYQLGNANADLKNFLSEPEIQIVLQSEPINFAPDLGAKTGTLLRFYTPHKGQRLDTLAQNIPPGYLWLLSKDLPQLPINHQPIGSFDTLELVQILESPNP